MKRTLLFIAATMILCVASQAQTTLKPHIGVNLTDVNIDQSNVSASGKAGVLAGLSVAFGKKLYIEPGLQYVAKSTEVTSTNNPDFQNKNYDLKGFRVPLAIGINLVGSQKSTVTFHGFGGLSAFFITNDNYNIDINKTNWGVFAGAGIDFWKLFVDASYEWSLSELSANTDNVEIGKTRSVYINAGFRFNLK